MMKHASILIAVSVYYCLSTACGTLAMANHNPSVASTNDVQYLERQVEELFQNAPSMPLVMTKKHDKNNNNKIEVRTSFDGDCMTSIAQATCVGHHPDDFCHFLENFQDAFPQINPMARNVLHLEGDPQTKQGVKSILKFPFPLRDRIMLHFKYLRLNRGPQEHMLILSERGNQDLLQNHFTKKEQQDYVLARTFLCVYWIRPLRCPNTGVVQGTSLQYAFSGDTGGNIPAWVQKQVGPKTALDSIQGLMDYVAKQKQKQPTNIKRQQQTMETATSP